MQLDTSTRGSPETRTGPGGTPTKGWLFIFVLLALLIVVLNIFFPKQTCEQQYNFRIVMALSVSGIGAIIPGFLDLDIRWLRFTLKAEGAIAMFFIILFTNLPSCAPTYPPGVSDLRVPDIAGEWEVTCTAQGTPFPDGGLSHGGTANIQVARASYGIRISLSGKKTWTMSPPNENGDMKKISVIPPSVWRTKNGYMVSEDEIQYEYETTDNDPVSHAVTRLRLIREGSKVVRLEGTFHRYQPGKNIYGTVIMIRLTHEKIAANADALD